VAWVVTDNKSVIGVDTIDGSRIWESVDFDAVTRAVHANFEYTLYVGSEDERLIALDEYSGEFLWSLQLQGQINADIVCGESGTIVYAGTDSGSIYAVDGGYDHNTLLWTFQLAGKPVQHLATQTDGSSGVVYAATHSSLFALAQGGGAVGEKLWQYEHKAGRVDALLVSINGEKLFTVWSEGKNSRLEAVDAAQGKKLWRVDFKGYHISRPAKQIDGTDEVLYIGYKHEVQAISSLDGKKLWALPLSSNIVHLLVWNFGTMLFATTSSQELHGISVTQADVVGTVLWEWSGAGGEELSAPSGGKSSVYVAAGTQLYSIPTLGGASVAPSTFSFGDAEITVGDDDAGDRYYSQDAAVAIETDGVSTSQERAIEQQAMVGKGAGGVWSAGGGYYVTLGGVTLVGAVLASVVRKVRRSEVLSDRSPPSVGSITMPIVGSMDVAHI
jgi:hypothetical protein